ncbi:ABC transporter substrate-binding protein [Variovorax sp. YR216]|uniref:ABC transporter substrate-binding protein n=1 Tax=Variovorax sp. YR216 TaxID=1882828 RepID=UPI000895B657|nr:ABC transporter substrate-binding protein [Variovorax sp. YR216]SEB05568.1 amino acid/amide ABC transporter substrate-binding protein, HAAT family [Variovorax sp. YR216]
MLDLRKPLAALALAMAGSFAAAPAAAQSPIRIGYLSTFSGPIGSLGQDMYDGFMLGVEQGGNKLGGVPVEILKQDDQFKPEVANQIVQKMIEKDKVPIITGVAGSNVMMAVQRAIAEKEVFLIGANAGPSELAGAQCSPYRFVASWQNDSWAEAAGKYANDKGYKRMLLVASNYQAGKDAVAGFKKFYTGQIVDEIYPGVTQPDFSAELTQIGADKPDAVFAFVPSGGINFIRQYQQAGLLKTVPLLTVGMADGTTLPALKESALGIQSVHFWAPDTDNPVSRQFVEAFEKKYGRIPSNFAAQGYDSALLLDAAIGRVKGDVSDKKAFMAALRQGSGKSVRGSLRFANNNFPINDWYAFEVAKDAKGRVSLKTVATPLKNYQDSYHAKCAMK